MKKIVFMIFVLSFLAYGCANQQAVADNTSNNTTSVSEKLSFSIVESLCDQDKLYMTLNSSGKYLGEATFDVLDKQSGSKPILYSSNESLSLFSGSNKVVFLHNQQLIGPMDFELCIGGDCQQSRCTMDTCLKYDIALACNARQDCFYERDFCRSFSCADFRDNESCNSHSQRCEWFINDPKSGNNYCRLRPCPYYNVKSDCEQGFGCDWTGASCVTFSCRNYNREALCNQDPRCNWEPSEYGSGSCGARE